MLLFDNSKVNHHWRNNLILFICIFLLFIVGPSLPIPDKSIYTNVFFTLLMLSGIFVIDYTAFVRKVLLWSGLLVTLVLWLEYFVDVQFLDAISFGLISIFLFTITISLIVHVALSKDVNANIIFSAINGYLLLGIIGSISLLIIDNINTQPVLNNLNNAGLKDYLYFSFVTLTTLGYGDITPAGDAGRVIALLLSITGQLYIAILIAMLVGKFLNKQK